MRIGSFDFFAGAGIVLGASDELRSLESGISFLYQIAHTSIFVGVTNVVVGNRQW
jgi:hypothetical protein